MYLIMGSLFLGVLRVRSIRASTEPTQSFYSLKGAKSSEEVCLLIKNTRTLMNI